MDRIRGRSGVDSHCSPNKAGVHIPELFSDIQKGELR
jgi:hypothetical protein